MRRNFKVFNLFFKAIFSLISAPPPYNILHNILYPYIAGDKTCIKFRHDILENITSVNLYITQLALDIMIVAIFSYDYGYYNFN